MKKRNHTYKLEDLNPLSCVCCGKAIPLLHPENEDLGHISSQTMWDGGIVQEISAGYGSVLDCDVYLIGICDDCIKIKRAEGSAIYLYDYMSGEGKRVKENRKEYNKKLHRKMKLERIVK